MRHGESAGNVARDAAELAGHPVIELPTRDVDVPLSPLGEAAGAGAGAMDRGRWRRRERPEAILCSPYIRARETVGLALDAVGIDRDRPTSLAVDERLREKEFGVLDRLTHLGIQQRFPEQRRDRLALGKFYHRPPGGESWCDVILRLRSVVDTLTREYRG